MANTIVKLTNPIEGHEGQIKEITLREPRYGDIMALGEPVAYARSEGGLLYTADRDEILKAYIERLLVSPQDPAMLIQVSLADALKLRAAVFDFFHVARSANSA